MKLVHKMILVFSVVALLAGFECILNASCSLVAYPVPKQIAMLDNTTQEPEEPPIEEPVEEPAEEIVQPKELTLLVYMAADNDLESYAIKNLKAMERANFSNLNVLVLLDRSEEYDETNDNWTDSRLFEVCHDNTNGSSIISKRISCAPLGLSQITPTELDMGDYTVLKAFIDFAKANYEAKQYALIVWGHGTGWRYSRAVAIDDKSHSYMCVKDMGLALKNQSISVIGFDTCFGSVFENLYELKECVQYIAACPGLSPASGWNYTMLLETLDASNFSAETIVNTMALSAPANLSITPANTLNELFSKIENFSKALAETITDETSRRRVFDILMNTKSYSYTQYPCDMYLDIFSMAEQFALHEEPTLSEAAAELKEAVSSKQIGLHFISKTGPGVLAAVHSEDYLKNDDNSSQCAFIKESDWWVPTSEKKSSSVLDKLFYTNF